MEETNNTPNTVVVDASMVEPIGDILHEACAIESFLLGWEKGLESLNNVSVGDLAKKMTAKFDKYWGKMEKVNMLMVIATVLDPRFKLRYVNFCYAELYEFAMVEVFTAKVKDLLKRIYDEYEKLNAGSSTSSQTSIDTEVDQPCLAGSAQPLTLQSKFQKHLEEVELDGERTEVDKYLEEPCEKVTSNFDNLNWWKVNSSKYKILSEVARDVLAIPVSTVSSEAAFNWPRATPLPFEIEENMAEMEELELALK
ncbi:hypothetical protein Acr_08g0010830 [Actinidia rufa]|uniref:Zinc finger BED domain-containing protein DAYSLEEPER-like n=1 Tax=Actinidia rufa TaxID=165716 RepID=A0A7J0F447_9ERIC|nr:hypothetical protein Acr_08g0010830 [Actinidia rufa]